MYTPNPFLPKRSIRKWKPDEALIDEVTKLKSQPLSAPEFMAPPNPAPRQQPQFLPMLEPDQPKPQPGPFDFRIP